MWKFAKNIHSLTPRQSQLKYQLPTTTTTTTARNELLQLAHGEKEENWFQLVQMTHV